VHNSALRIAPDDPKKMTAAELQTKWSKRLEEWRALCVRVDGEKIAREILEDLRGLVDEDLVTLSEASRLGGYSVDHLSRLLREGTLENRGRKHAPRIRRAEVPTKPGHALLASSRESLFSSRRRIVADALANNEATHG